MEGKFPFKLRNIGTEFANVILVKSPKTSKISGKDPTYVRAEGDIVQCNSIRHQLIDILKLIILKIAHREAR